MGISFAEGSVLIGILSLTPVVNESSFGICLFSLSFCLSFNAGAGVPELCFAASVITPGVAKSFHIKLFGVAGAAET